MNKRQILLRKLALPIFALSSFMVLACSEQGSSIKCDPACDMGTCQICQEGVCVSSCSTDQICEDGACVDAPACVPACDSSACMTCQEGECASTCTPDQQCEDGVCQKKLRCSPPCLPNVCMVCQDGDCVSACTADQYCDNGFCRDYPDCDPACETIVCEVCQEGRCVNTCFANQRCVDGACQDIPDCDPPCFSSDCMVCQEEGCVYACSENQDCDNGVCRDIIDCDPACDPTACETCRYGECVGFCLSGQECLTGDCLYASGMQMGEACEYGYDCGSGRCYKETGDTVGYCMDTDCQMNESCVNHAEGETAEMCCIEIESFISFCLKTAEGYPCGDGTGDCGASCTGYGRSACQTGIDCIGESLEDPIAVCAPECNTDEQCNGCAFAPDPSVTIRCMWRASGNHACLPFFDLPCLTNRDCPLEDVCTVEVDEATNSLTTHCANLGDIHAGSTCDETLDQTTLAVEDRCSSLVCLGNICSQICESTYDCINDDVCISYSIPGVDGSVGMCSGNSGCLGPNDCEDWMTCWPTLVDETLTGLCRSDSGDLELGSPCESDDVCQAICVNGRCSEWCGSDDDCPGNMTCQTTDLCMLEPCDLPENNLPASVCRQDAGCGGPSDCPEGQACLPDLESSPPLLGQCVLDLGPLPLGSSCDPDDSQCEGMCLTNRCSEWCSADIECPPPMNCEVVYYCPQEPCDAEDDLAEGSVCLAY
ncbi:MAG: hypothetical protein JRF33_00455 [Deltaproteobacteria bacterium]|nr:hypothetical protein [Deltaproteobacteria bacterium]